MQIIFKWNEVISIGILVRLSEKYGIIIVPSFA